MTSVEEQQSAEAHVDPDAVCVPSDTPPDPDSLWVELRIHGVSGTPPEDMLGVPHVVQIAGDSTRRVFRRADCNGDPLPPDGCGRILEGYHWGNLTSGSWRQGLWLVLIPFGLINASQFMLSPLPDEADVEAGLIPNRRRNLAYVSHVMSGAMLRFVALGMTCVLSFSVTFILMGLAGIEGARNWHLAEWLAHGGASGIGLVASGAFVFLLYWVGGRTHLLTGGPERTLPLDAFSALSRKDFLVGDPSVPALRRLHLGAGLALACVPGGLTVARDTYGGVGDTLAEWSCAVAVSLVVCIGVLVLIVGDPSDSASLDVAGWYKSIRAKIRTFVGVANWVVLAVAVLLLIEEAVLLAAVGFRADRAALGGIDEVADFLAYSVLSGVILLFLFNLFLALNTFDIYPPGARRYFGRYARGFAASFVTSLGVFIGLGFAGAFAYAASKALGVSTDNFPGILQRIAYAWGLTAIVLAAVLVLLLVHWLVRSGFVYPGPRKGPGVPRLRSTFRSRGNLDFEVPDPSRMKVADEWEPKIATAMWMARLKRCMTLLVIVYVGMGVAMSSVAGFETSADHGRCPTAIVPDSWCEDGLPRSVRWLSQTQADGTQFLMWLGTTTLLLLAALLVSVGRGAIRAQSKRRGVNVLWDVIAFWPHSVHPFAPPPYSQLVVLNLRDRIRWHLQLPPEDGEEAHPEAAAPKEKRRRPVMGPERFPRLRNAVRSWLSLPEKKGAVAEHQALAGPVAEPRAEHQVLPGPVADPRAQAGPAPKKGVRHVVLAAHSQGSLIAFAAMMWLRPSERERVGLITHGSQLQVAFPRAFPQYVNWKALLRLHEELDRRWLNLYRETDPIAGPVFSWAHWDRPRRDRERVFLETKGDPPRPAYPYSSRTLWSPQQEQPDVVYRGLRVCGYDWRLLDPTPYDVATQTGPVWRILGHSSHFADPAWPYAVNAVAGRHVLPPFPQPLWPWPEDDDPPAPGPGGVP